MAKTKTKGTAKTVSDTPVPQPITIRSTNPKIMADNILKLEESIKAADVSANPSGTAEDTLLTTIGIDGKKYDLGPSAENTSYDNTDSGLTADDVQAAIDELVTVLNDKVEITSDGTKTYSEILETLLGLIDTDKVTSKSCLIIETDNKDFIYSLNYINLAAGGMDFSRSSLTLSSNVYVTWITFINMRNSGNSKNIELLGSTVTDNSNTTVSDSVKFIFKY